MNRLEKILRPKSIAVIGASRKEGSLGKMFLQAILRMHYTGEIFPINPKADEIEGLKVYPNIAALPQTPDLAIILLPHPFVPGSLEEIGRAGIRDVIVISAGFREVGGEGVEREKQLVAIGEKYGMNILGPNCMGIFNTDAACSFNGTFSPTLPQPGHVAYVSQSGALGVAILELTAGSDLGFSIFVSTGNKADISDNDVLEFLMEDDNTRVITLYLESVDRPERFRSIATKIAARKPLLAVKAGRTASGFKAASSHTGALANPEHIVDGFLKQCGVIRQNTLEELFDAARLLALQPLPRGARTAVVTNAGGPGILASDAIEQSGLTLAAFSAQTVAALKENLPAEAATGNPVDMIASAGEETYFQTLKTVLADDNVDSVLLIMVKPPVNATPAQIIRRLVPLVKEADKPVVPVLMAQKDESAGLDIFKELNLAVFDYPESAVKALATMWQYRQIQNHFSEQKTESPKERARTATVLSPGKADQAPLQPLLELLRAYEIPVAPFAVSAQPQQLLNFVKENDAPFAVKIASEEIIHKSDEGMLKLNLQSPEDVTQAIQAIAEKAQSVLPKGSQPLYLIQKQMPRGLELVLGGKRDEQFGAVVMAGIGGIFVEALKDVAFRVAPLSIEEALDMLADLQAQKLLDGFRGQAAVERRALAATIHKFSMLLYEHPEIAEMDLNPLIWQENLNQAVVVDARATVK